MRSIIFLLLLLHFHEIFSQRTFFISSQVGTQTISINGIHYSINDLGTKIKTRYPKFDVLKFYRESENSTTSIICNFKPDTSYVITLACCGSLDILPASKLKCDSLRFWDMEEDLYKIQGQLMDKPFISIRTKKDPKDSIYAWHSDAACMTEHKAINTKLWRLGVPPKCFYWTNITTILFFKQDHTLPKHEATFLEEFLEKNNIVELTSITFRLFDDERFVVIFDEKNNSATLQYE